MTVKELIEVLEQVEHNDEIEVYINGDDIDKVECCIGEIDLINESQLDRIDEYR